MFESIKIIYTLLKIHKIIMQQSILRILLTKLQIIYYEYKLIKLVRNNTKNKA